MTQKTKTLLRGALLGAVALAIGGCYYGPVPAPYAYDYGYYGYPAYYGGYYYGGPSVSFGYFGRGGWHGGHHWH
jgi:hypothetical protein